MMPDQEEREKLASRVVVDEFRPTVEGAPDNEWAAGRISFV